MVRPSVEMNPRYRDIVDAVEAEFRRNVELHGDRIQCRAGCSDCCSHYFEITAIDAAVIARALAKMDPHTRDALVHRARAHIAARRDLPPKARLACSALVDGVCSIYDARPLICRKFGMPIYNPDKPGRIFACELNFRDGEEIHDPQLIQIQTAIHQDWKGLQAEYPASPGSPSTVAAAIAGTPG